MGVWPDGIFISLSGLETRFTSGPFDGVTSWRPLLGLASSSTCEPSYRLLSTCEPYYRLPFWLSLRYIYCSFNLHGCATP